MLASLRPYLIGFAVALLLTIGAILGMQWVREHPEHFPGVRFELAHRQGWATKRKLVALASDDGACFAAFDREGAGYLRRPAMGTGVCRASQRMILTGNKYAPTMRPAGAAPGCAVTAALILWDRDVVQPLAQKHFGQRVVEIENLGSYNCRKIAGQQSQSQHSTANAIDVSAFVLADGTRISLINDWRPATSGAPSCTRSATDRATCSAPCCRPTIMKRMPIISIWTWRRGRRAGRSAARR